MAKVDLLDSHEKIESIFIMIDFVQKGIYLTDNNLVAVLFRR